MKKINKYIIAAAIPLLGILAACTDGNDWSTDSSVTRQRTPEGLTVEVDSTTLNMEVKWTKAAGAASYEIQVSENPLAEGFDDAQGIPTFTATESPLTIDRLNDQFQIKENTTYYVRLRAISATKSPSKWVTDDITSGMYATKTPATMWIDALGIDYNQLTMQWIKIKYASVAAVVNENTGTRHELTEEEKDTRNYTATDLEPNAEYIFTLYDEEGNQIGQVRESTETKPNMDNALSILDFSTWVDGVREFSSGGFVATFENTNNKQKYEAEKFDRYVMPDKTMSPAKDVDPSDPAYKYLIKDRLSTGGKSTSGNQIFLTIPSSGRLYLYTRSGSAGRYVYLMGFDDATQEYAIHIIPEGKGDDADGRGKEVPTTKNVKDPVSGKENQGYAFTKIKVPAGGTYLLSYSASIYFQGFCFIPDEE
jgi:hypothetical protein